MQKQKRFVTQNIKQLLFNTIFLILQIVLHNFIVIGVILYYYSIFSEITQLKVIND